MEAQKTLIKQKGIPLCLQAWRGICYFGCCCGTGVDEALQETREELKQVREEMEAWQAQYQVQCVKIKKQKATSECLKVRMPLYLCVCVVEMHRCLSTGTCAPTRVGAEDCCAEGRRGGAAQSLPVVSVSVLISTIPHKHHNCARVERLLKGSCQDTEQMVQKSSLATLTTFTIALKRSVWLWPMSKCV